VKYFDGLYTYNTMHHLRSGKAIIIIIYSIYRFVERNRRKYERPRQCATAENVSAHNVIINIMLSAHNSIDSAVMVGTVRNSKSSEIHSSTRD